MQSLIAKFGKWCGVEGTFASWFVTIGVLTQLVTCYIMNESALAVCSGIAGVISVVLCSQKKYAFYFWGLLQLITILIISANSGLNGKILENLFYLITMFVGMLHWKENSNGNETQVRKMDIADYILFGCLFLPLSAGLSYMTVYGFNTGQFALDAITTTIGILAQIMLVLRFREQWVLWFILDVLCVVLWAKDGNWCLSVQYVFWTINCIYGFLCWKPKQVTDN